MLTFMKIRLTLWQLIKSRYKLKSNGAAKAPFFYYYRYSLLFLNAMRCLRKRPFFDRKRDEYLIQTTLIRMIISIIFFHYMTISYCLNQEQTLLIYYYLIFYRC
jgi:hypothetical protein